MEEKRSFHVTQDTQEITGNCNFVGIKSAIEVTYERTIKGKISTETRYYVSSLSASPEEFLKIIRPHWEIENKLHWVLNMTFNEDRSRNRQRNAPMNMEMIRHVVLNMLRKLPKTAESIKGLRKKARWSDELL